MRARPAVTWLWAFAGAGCLDYDALHSGDGAPRGDLAGLRSLRAQVPAGSNSAQLVRSIPASMDVFLRAYVYFAVTPNDWSLLGLQELGGFLVELGISDGGNWVLLENGSVAIDSGVAVVPQNWYCLELQLSNPGANGVIEGWVDDNSLFTDNPQMGNMNIDQAMIELWPSGAGAQAANVFFDEVLIDTARIPCAR
jgi:hypothetical protein